MTSARRIVGFPDPVNEIAARIVATGVVALAVTYLVTRSPLVLALLAYGFVARVVTGPTLSPLGRMASSVLAPRLGPPRLVPGPPKRFAQAMGATFTVGALVAHALGAGTAAFVLIAGLTAAASLEAALGLCLGCKIFALLMRLGVIPESVCAACADLSLRQPA